jgi:hypothetical protein
MNLKCEKLRRCFAVALICDGASVEFRRDLLEGFCRCHPGRVVTDAKISTMGGIRFGKARLGSRLQPYTPAGIVRAVREVLLLTSHHGNAI